METKAQHFLIGAFVLALTAGIFATIIWLARLDISQGVSHYVIYFTDSVAGLGLGGDVRFNGIKVGSVSAIDIDPDDSRRVKVTVEIASNTPIRADSVAQLQLQGITGLSFVQISGGTPAAKLLKARRSQPPPVIQSKSSDIARLFESAPEVLAKTTAALDKLNQILGADNQKSISRVLADAADVADTIDQHRQDLAHILEAASKSADDVSVAAKAVREITEKLNHVSDETEQTMRSTRQTMENANKLVVDAQQSVSQLNGILGDNRQAISEFANDGLPQLTRFVMEARQLVAVLSRLSERLENDPSRFIFGDKAPERRAQ
ncbi:MAG TPA: MlaD family protein [Candidatus Cybelea sp.]|nr:MlaD family protein [Candidatus Cybelea sp.]